MNADAGASEPHQTVVTTSSVRDQVLPAVGSATEGATIDWPEHLDVRDLLQSGTQDDQARLAPLIKQMTLRQDVGHSELKGYFCNLDVEVATVWLGRQVDGVTPLATVAFSTLQDALRAKDMVRSGDSQVDLVSELFDYRSANRSASRRRLFFKNYCLVMFERRDLETRLASYGQGVSVQLNSYWDGRQKQYTPTDVILSGCVEFAEESHANKLWADLESTKGDGQEDMMVLKRIRGIAAPIAFQRDHGYASRGA